MKNSFLFLIVLALGMILLSPAGDQLKYSGSVNNRNLNILYAEKAKNWGWCEIYHFCYFCCMGTDYSHCNTPGCHKCNVY